MARRKRLFIPGIPTHVYQRGNNKIPIFFSEKDYSLFLNMLQEAKVKHPCLIYGYCLMPNHFHLLIEPEEKNNISLLMKFLGAKYVHYINKIHSRTGTLWEGRFKCSLVDREAYFLTCLRYIELNPIRAGLVKSLALYKWSSYRARALGEKSKVLDLSKWYFDLGNDSFERQNRYKEFFRDYTIPEPAHLLIKEMLHKGGLTGDTKFKEQIEGILGRKILFRPQGRPFKEQFNVQSGRSSGD